MKALSVGVADCNGEAAAFLYAEANLPEGPPRHMVLPDKGDAGHLAAMALYLCYNADDAMIYVHESAMSILGCPEVLTPEVPWELAEAAARRVVLIERTSDGLVLTSADGESRHVWITFPAWSHELQGCEDALQLLDLATALHDKATVVSM